MVFDIIYLVSPKGEEFPLTEVILTDRKMILKKIITPIPKIIEVIEGKETNSVDEIMSEFNEALSKNEEGIIIKKKDSIYKPDERCNDWVKMKCDYIDTLNDSLDLLILGGYYGEGKRRIQSGTSNNFNDHISSFLIGVVKSIDLINPKNSVILPISKVGTGYSVEELEMLRQKLKNSWKKYDPRMPARLFGNWIPAISERPDVYIEDPSTSIIFEVKAAELFNSESFPTKLSLRFPRVLKIRFDKNWNECLKFDDVKKYIDKPSRNQIIADGKKLEDFDEDLDNKLEKKRGKKAKKVDKFNRVQEDFRDTDINNLSVINNLFKGLEFLILNLDNSEHSYDFKRTLESVIYENGGNKVQNYLPSTTHVIANNIDIRANYLLKNYDVNLYSPKWVLDCVKYNKLIPVSPLYLTHANKYTRNLFNRTLDCYNDDYFEEVTTDSLLEIFATIENYKEEKEYESCVNSLKKQYPNVKIFN